KYAGGRNALEGVLAFVGEATSRLAELEGQSARAATLTAEHAAAVAELERAARDLGTARRAAAGELAAAVQRELRDLAMPKGRFEIGLAPRPGGEDDLRALAAEDVTFMLGANPGEPLLPLSRVASGGELARAMLALRLVLSAPTGEGAPRTLVFDEVDAGVGGEAALAVGRALAQLGQRYQVIVVTHLPQVAACADAQVAVTKSEVKGRTRADAQVVTGKERVVELSRMLSGQPDSATAQRHAEELLCSARKAGG
ncbi:MAG TPA: hypothetical protein VK425_04825, partial [Acidimicrobiales bacterium]|nr:hypothetical protein [Acidimicrobiales bacterium]